MLTLLSSFCDSNKDTKFGYEKKIQTNQVVNHFHYTPGAVLGVLHCLVSSLGARLFCFNLRGDRQTFVPQGIGGNTVYQSTSLTGDLPVLLIQ
jgi:hypothetical protein